MQYDIKVPDISLIRRHKLTALNWFMKEDYIAIASDTLVAQIGDGKPLCFINKIYPLPHAQALIAGTGVADVVFNAANLLFSNCACCSTNILLNYLSNILVSLYANYNYDASTTVYLFGWNDKTNIMEGYALRSNNGFKYEKLEYGLGIKPIIPIEYESIIINEEFFINIITKQRIINDDKRDDKVYIGGQIIYVTYTRDIMSINTIYSFSDYFDMIKKIK